MSENFEHVYTDPQGENPGGKLHEIGEHLQHAFDVANRVKNLGYKVYSRINNKEGEELELVHDNYTVEPSEHDGHFWLKLKEEVKDNKGAVTAGVLVTGAAITVCIKAIRQRRK